MKYDSFIIDIITLAVLKCQNRISLPCVSLSRLKIPVSLSFGWIFDRYVIICNYTLIYMHLLTTSAFNCGHGMRYCYASVFWPYPVLISRWVLTRNKCLCHKFKAELRIIHVKFRNFLSLVKMISSLEYFSRKYLPPSCQFTWFSCVLIHVLNNNSFMEIHKSVMDIHDWIIYLHNWIYL